MPRDSSDDAERTLAATDGQADTQTSNDMTENDVTAGDATSNDMTGETPGDMPDDATGDMTDGGTTNDATGADAADGDSPASRCLALGHRPFSAMASAFGSLVGSALSPRPRPTSRSQSLIRSLRMKFVLLGTASILLVLSVILGMAELAIYSELTETADHTLALLADGNGTFPEDARSYGLYDDQITRETPYESIWFIVRGRGRRTEGDGVAWDRVDVDTSRTVALGEDTARGYAETAAANGHAFGFVNSFRFIHRQDADGDLFVFLDRGRQLQSFRRGALATAAIAAMGVAAFAVILVLASKPVMRPFAEAHAKQRRFITDAGHDIKTPLAIIAADADVLSMEVGDDNEWVSDIRRQVSDLTRLTNDLIFLSRMEEDRNDRADVEFSLSDAVGDVTDSFATLCRADGKELVRDISPDVRVRGDERMMRQLTSALLDNAVKYSADGGTVAVSLARRRKSVTLSVRNTAPDESSVADADRWFDRFYQSDSARSHGRGGFGIGLSMALAVVSAHSGQIRADYRDGDVVISATMPIGA